MPKTNAIAHRLISEKKRIESLARKHGVRNVRIFGSVARGDSMRNSDIDILVDAFRGTTLFDLAGLQLDLEDLLKQKVDVRTPGDIHPRMMHRVLAGAVTLEEFAARHTAKQVLKAGKLGSRMAARLAKQGVSAKRGFRSSKIAELE